ncbi:MAG: sulfate ABC transporter substrate-binding protein [Gemmatimonadaceae bacterium]
MLLPAPRHTIRRRSAVTLSLSLLSLAMACEGTTKGATPTNAATLTLGAYTTPREAYGQDILPAFATEWRTKTGNTIAFEESYLGSGAQARAIASGFEADVAALSLEPDIETLTKAGLITHEWRQGSTGGMVSRSVVVIAVRPGNPKQIHDWADLRKPGIQVLTPNPRTSGGAMWNIAAIYGAALRGASGAQVAAGDSTGAEGLLRSILANVSIMDKGARESILTFENGVGDAAITYENEVLTARQSGKAMDYVIPRSTILIENPVAVVDRYVDKRGTRQAAEAFVTHLTTPGVQRMFAKHGFRPVDDDVAKEYAKDFPAVTDLFTIRDLGGWKRVTPALFSDSGVFARASSKGNAK